MPIHERQQLREAIVAQLKGPLNNRTAAGARVTKSRRPPQTTDALPAISVYSVDEPVSEASASTAPRELTRQVKVEIVGWVLYVTGSPVDDALDALALQIETAMDLDPNLNGCAFDSLLESTALGEDLSGDRGMGAVSMVFACTYKTETRNPLPTADFALAGVTTNLGGTQAVADQASGLVTIPIT